MADFLQLTDTPGSYSAANNKFARVNNTGTGIQFWNVTVNDLEDTITDGAYVPQTGEALIFQGDGKWKPGSLDVYSAGNGLNKVGLGLNVQAKVDGGLLSDGTGISLTAIADVAGIYGNASTIPVVTINDKGQVTNVTATAIVATSAETITGDFVSTVTGTSGQITVVGGTGNNSSAEIHLVATGVTAATYGNATTIPQITVDGYGRIQNVDLITAAGGSGSDSGGVDLAYKNIVVSGQVMLSADEAEDTLTFIAGSGVSLTTNAGDDSISIAVDADTIVSQASVGTLNDVDTTGATNGQALVWDQAGSAWMPGTVATALGVTGVTAGTYGNASSVPQFTVDDKGRITSATSVAIPQGDITDVVAGTGLSGGGVTGSVTLNLEQSGAVPGTYGSASSTAQITVDVLGRVTSITSVDVPVGDITSVVAGEGLTGGATLGAATLALDVSGVTAGTYGNTGNIAQVTVDDKGRVTNVTETPAIGASGVTAGTYGEGTIIPQFTVDAEGRISSVSNISVASHIQALSWNAGTNILGIGGANTVDLSTLAGSDLSVSSISDLSDISDTTGIANGQALLWNSTSSKFEHGNVLLTNDSYKTISVAGQTDVVATGSDTLTLVAGVGVQIATDPGTDSITINSSATGNLDFGSFSAPVGMTLDMGPF